MERTDLNNMEKTVFNVNKTDFMAWIDEYVYRMALEEKSPLTRRQYRHDILQFIGWLDAPAEGIRGTENPAAADNDSLELNKEDVIAYKEKLRKDYQASTVNCKLAALNSFWSYVKMTELRVRQLKLQRRTFCSAEKELTQAEYERLIKAARKTGDERLKLIMETICSTGIRVSELKFITVEAVRNGETTIQLKGKTRPLLLPLRLQNRLKEYIKCKEISAGPVFITSTGKCLDRSNIWRMMKGLCRIANVEPGKVFPHALRHLFARCFYSATKDIAKLADILGHSSINTTRIYIISTGEEHQRQLDALKLVI